MGDLERWELQQIAADNRIDRYEDWYREHVQGFLGYNDPKLPTLVSWKQFYWGCYRCDQGDMVVAADENLYQFDCGHFGSREDIDHAVQQFKAGEHFDQEFLKEYMAECPVDMVKVPAVFSQDAWWTNFEDRHHEYLLSCGHWIRNDTGGLIDRPKGWENE